MQTIRATKKSRPCVRHALVAPRPARFRRPFAMDAFARLGFALALGLTLGIGVPDEAHADDQALVYSTDFATADYSSMDTSAPFGRDINLGAACADAVARAHGNLVYLVGRFGCNNIQVVDPGNGFQTILQFSTGPGTNPHDIELCAPDKAYVSLYDADSLLIVHPTTGAALGSVDLSMFSDDDGLPEADEMVLVGDRLFVALQRLDRNQGYAPTNPSFVAVIDCTTDEVIDVDPDADGVQAIELSGRNPFGELRYDRLRGKIVVAETGAFGMLDGGVEFIDPVALQAGGFFIDESELGGDLNAARLYVDCTGYAIITDALFNTQLVRFDRCNGTLTEVCLTTPGFNLSDLEISTDGLVFVADRDLIAPGIRVYDAPTCTEITGSPLGVGIPPQDIALIQHDTPSSTLPVPVAGVRLLPNRPNPFNPATTLRFVMPAGVAGVLELFDARGRALGVVWRGTGNGSMTEVAWRGRDVHGRELPSGVYTARLRAGGVIQARTLTLLR